ncbi:MAG: hypothetical protein COA44_12510 [Arcobacter sp.]|nr:MAG: hypothetical protein COA44_12510 [Arcobacter sp.]
MFNPEKINKLEPVYNYYKQDAAYAFSMAKKDKIDFIYNTSALEGNAMTYPEVQTLLEGVTVGGHKLSDEQQVLNQSRSIELLFKMIEESTFILNKECVCSLHKEVAREEALSWGVFRTANVNIGGTQYLPPQANILDEIFKDGVKKLQSIKDPILKALTYFLFGARTQFFFDGNKRTSRLIMNGLLLIEGLPMLNIKARDKLEFNKEMIAFYDSGDYIKTLTYFSNYYHQENKHMSLKDG